VSKIFEGMWANDLEDLLQPVVSIDEYESKVDDSAIAIGFFVNDRDAAGDLNRFIQKSAVPIIDSDVSPAPDQRGYYIVFAELPGNDRFTDNLLHLCEEVGQLGGVEHWQMKMRGIKHVCKLDAHKVKLGLLRNSMADKLTSLRADLESIKTTRRTK
jgi:hypothetical protein